MRKKLIRLTESDLHRIVKESVNSILNELDSDYYFGDKPSYEPQIGSEEWFEDEIDPHYSQVGNYDNMSNDFVDWSNMNDRNNDYDAAKSWDNNFKKLENERSWSQFDTQKQNAQKMYNQSKYIPHFLKGKMPKANGNTYDNRRASTNYAKYGKISVD